MATSNCKRRARPVPCAGVTGRSANSKSKPLRRRRMSSHVDRVVVSQARINRRVRELAQDIERSFRGRQLVILAVMTGSLIFLADLIRRLPQMVRLVLVSARSYRGKCTSPLGRPVIGCIPAELAGADVLIIDDILDTGGTLGRLLREVHKRRPRSVRTCVLLKKVRPGVNHRPGADFVGFEIEDQFVVGYGLDYDNLYRNLPDICVLKRHIAKRP